MFIINTVYGNEFLKQMVLRDIPPSSCFRTLEYDITDKRYIQMVLIYANNIQYNSKIKYLQYKINDLNSSSNKDFVFIKQKSISKVITDID